MGNGCDNQRLSKHSSPPLSLANLATFNFYTQKNKKRPQRNEHHLQLQECDAACHLPSQALARWRLQQHPSGRTLMFQADLRQGSTWAGFPQGGGVPCEKPRSEQIGRKENLRAEPLMN
mmetsp:Transcript_48694/g.104035  ORF Transcript_48694/g.104035 Transcript_48694/m.104035 type:complete len:119 (-) Transcript_48694:133-489(-)|eukprot:CAMPEP_0206495290 /NCGR_PEP_ID=MMETSP0324_2-20121206/48381_1 /ASSEMBLY_ACC=CAM_ASM_000836 /TAXON_ID=2866 /ORGANISM="Crypthecodinium cohnii, Strain Seligo" /LENGTH=118 /DNA_ID=CAMNT_0053979399 /DNA_START=407 /DNA_END=763 /DNA_ORIENTATION=-